LCRIRRKAVDPADRPGAPGADQRRQPCLRPQGTNIIVQLGPSEGRVHKGGESPSKDRECDETAEPASVRTLFELSSQVNASFTVATHSCKIQSASHRLMKIPGQMVRTPFLAPTASSGLQSSVAMARSESLTKAGRPGLLVGSRIRPPLRLLHIQRSGRGEPAIEVVLLRHEL
jgi:hypothetical protein